MSLSACKECGNQISSMAKVCPHCGAPRGTKRLGWVILAIVLLCAGVFHFIATADTQPPPPLSSFGINEGMDMSQVAMQLEGKVAGIDYIGDRRRRNVSTGELDGSYVTIITQSIYYEVDGTRRRLRVYFWDDRVKSIEWQ